MSKYIVLLRGINVSGQKKIKMADLRTLLEKSGFENVQTYIQSGNIVLSSKEQNLKSIALSIEEIIEKAYDFHVPTLVIQNDYMVTVLKNNPYQKDPSKEIPKMGFTFLYSPPTKENIDKLFSYNYPNEEMIMNGDIVYLYSGNGMGKAKISNNFIENKLKVTASSRNYNTVIKLIEMSK